MTRLFPVIFFLLVGLVVAGVDYLGQARKAGLPPGAFGASAYVDSVTGRYFKQMAAMAAEKKRRALIAQPTRNHLPEAPEAWTRRPWDEAAAGLLSNRYDLQKDDFVPDAIKNDPTMRLLTGMDKAAQAQADATEVYVYERGTDLVSLRLRYRKDDAPGGLTGFAIAIVSGNIEAMSGKDGFAIVGGVTFREELGLFGGIVPEEQERPYRVITGKIGDRIDIVATARADDAAILELLRALDIDLLNSMLEAPVPGIGSKASAIAEAEMTAEADKRVEAASKAQIGEGIRREQEMMAAALELSRTAGSISDEEYRVAKEKLDAMARAAEAGGATPLGDASAAGAGDGEPATEGGGVMGWLRSAFGSGKSTVEDEPVRPVAKVIRPGDGNCVRQGAAKRCSVATGN